MSVEATSGLEELLVRGMVRLSTYRCSGGHSERKFKVSMALLCKSNVCPFMGVPVAQSSKRSRKKLIHEIFILEAGNRSADHFSLYIHGKA